MHTPFHRLSFLLTISIFCFHLVSLVPSLDCTKSKEEWRELPFVSNLDNTLDTISRESGATNVCPVSTGPSCCSQQMEQDMLVFGRQHLVNMTSPHLSRVAEQMSSDGVALKNFFLADLEQAQDRLHKFFSPIYGYNYKLHQRFFFQFFADLKAYVTGERSQLDHLMDNFFNQLRDSIVSLIERSGQAEPSSYYGANKDRVNNLGSSVPGTPVLSSDSSLAFDNNMPDEAGEVRRIRCLSERIAQLRPFNNVDVHLKARVMKVYPPARMLVNVLSVTGRLLIYLLKQVSERPECTIGITRFRFCALCAGKSISSTCPGSCEKLLSSCLGVNGPANVQLNFVWPRLIGSIVSATESLESSFNFPAVNRHLQMDISEAITSLQTRYDQTKSKFQSECRMGFTGRTVPALFSSTSRLPQSGIRLPLASIWPPNIGGFRGNRVAESRLLRRSAYSAASPELLDWQTRRQLPSGSSVDFGLRSLSDDNSRSQIYGQTHNAHSFDSDHDASSNQMVSDPSEHLMRWALQLKRSYSSLRDLFALLGSEFCAVPPMHPTATNVSNTAGCWTPPELSNPQADQGLTETAQMLALAAERLQLASSNDGDPETLILRSSLVERQPANLHVAPMTLPSNEPFRSQSSSFSAQTRWNVDQRTGPYGSLETHTEQDEPLGSGLGLVSGEREGMYENELRRPISTSLGATGGRTSDASLGFGRYQPYDIPNANQWPISTSNNLDSSTDAGYGEPTVTRGPLQPLTDRAVIQTTSSVLRDISPTDPTIDATINAESGTAGNTATIASTEITTEPDTPGFLTFATTASTPDPPLMQTSEAMSLQQGSSSTDHSRGKITSAPYAASTVSVHDNNWQPNLPEAQQPVYGGLPDDEDSLGRPGVDIAAFPQQPTTSSPPWNEQQSSWSGEAQGNWWEDPYVGGSGLPPPGQAPFNKPSRGTLSERLNQPDAGVSRSYLSPGSGRLPFQPAPERPLDILPSQLDRTFENQPPSWPRPAFPGGVTPDTEWAGGKPGETVERTSDWQDNLQGSGAPDPTRFIPTHIQPSDPMGTSHQPQISPPVIGTQPPIAYPPLPPPEVWVPAQIGPDQSMPSVLLVRRYNLQSPLYDPEVVTPQTGRCSPPCSVCVFVTLLLPAALHCLLSVVFYSTSHAACT